MRGKLPKIVVTTRGELAVVLNAWRSLLDERAAAMLPVPDAAQEAVRRTVLKLLAVEQPRSTHTLRWMLQTLRDECRAVARRRKRLEAAKERACQAGAPVDRILGPLTGATAEAVRKLPREERDVLTLAAEGVRPTEIGALLGVPRKTVSQQLWRARRRVMAEVEAMKSGAPLGVAVISRVSAHSSLTRHSTRLGRAIHVCATAPQSTMSRLTTLLGQVDATQITMATAVLAAAVGTWAVAPAGGGQRLVETPPRAVEFTASTASSESPAIVSSQPASDGLPAVARSGQLASPLLLPPPRADAPAETPSDSQFVAVAPASSDSAHDTVVALGIGHTCGCRVLFQSTDGGRTWGTAAGPAQGDEIALPPTYPADPRIFVGTDRASGGTVSVSASFGAPFEPISSLLPSGHVSLSSGFDDGDPRVFVAGATGVVSYTIGAPAPVPLVSYSPLDTPAALAAETGDTGAAILMAVPASAAVVGDHSTVAVPTGQPRLIECGRWSGCSVLASIPLPSVVGIEVSAGSPQQPAVVAIGSQEVARSIDGGRDFEAVSLPPATTSLVSAALFEQDIWTVTMQGHSSHVERTNLRETAWSDLAAGAMPASEGQMVALSRMRLLYLPVGAGFLCSEDGGVSWARGCL